MVVPQARLSVLCWLRRAGSDVIGACPIRPVCPTALPCCVRGSLGCGRRTISGRLRDETATRNRYAIRGYMSTARKHGINAFTAIKDALTGNLWIPPIPAST